MENKRGTLVSVKDHISDLTEDLYQLQQNDILCDLILEANDGNVSAHAVIVSAASSYLKRIIAGTCVCTPNISVSIPEFSVESLKSVLQYMYTGKIFVSASNVRSITSCFKHFEMYSELKKVMKNFPVEDLPVSDKDTWHKENMISSSEGKKSVINISWSERLRNALRETNHTNIVQESEEKKSDVLDVLKKSVEAVSDKSKEKLPINHNVHKPVSNDKNNLICVNPRNKTSLAVDVNNCDRYTVDVNSFDRYTVDVNSCDRNTVDVNSCDRNTVDVNSCDRNTIDVNSWDQNKKFSCGKRQKDKIKRFKEPMAKIPKLHKHSCRKLMSKIGGDFKTLFLKRETGFSGYEDSDDSSSTCESDILNEFLDKNEYTSDSSEDDHQPSVICKAPNKIEAVSGMQKSLDFITDSKNMQHFFSYQNKMAVDDESIQVQNSDLDLSKDKPTTEKDNIIDDPLSNLSEDIGLLGAALSKGFLNKESTPDICVDQKTLIQNTMHMTSPMSEMSANYTSETYCSQASMSSDLSGNHTSHISDTNIDQVPVSPDVCTSQVSYISESSMFHNPMLSDASTDHEREKMPLGTSACHLDFITSNDICMEQQEKSHAEESVSLMHKTLENGRKMDQKSEQRRSSLVSTMNLLDANDIENRTQCNLDSSFNFSLSSEMLNTYQQTGTDDQQTGTDVNKNAENPATSNIYVNTTELSGHHIVEHFENIDQLEMTPELLEAVVNPEFVQHFNNENVVSVGNLDTVCSEQQGTSALGQEEQTIGQSYNSIQSHPVRKEQVIMKSYDTNQAQPGTIINEACNIDQNQSGEIVIQSESFGNIVNSQMEPLVIQSHDATHNTNIIQSQEVIIQVPNEDQFENTQMEHIIIQAEEGTREDIPGEMGQIIIETEDGTILKTSQVSDNVFDRIQNYIEWSQRNTTTSEEDQVLNDGSHEKITHLDGIKQTSFKKKLYCRTCGLDFQSEMAFKLHREKEHPLAHCTQLKRSDKRKQLEQMYSKIEHIMKSKKSNNSADIQGFGEALKQTLKEIHKSSEQNDTGDETDAIDKNDGHDATQGTLNKAKGTTKCRTCKIDFHDEKKFHRHRKQMHPVAHMTWLKRRKRKNSSIKASEKFLKQLSYVDLIDTWGSSNENSENDKAVNVLGEIIQKYDNLRDDNEDTFEHQKDSFPLQEGIESEEESNSSDSSDVYDRRMLSSTVNLTGRIRRVTYCRTCAINFETTDKYKLHREKVHPLAHKIWLARNAVKEKINNLIYKKFKKASKRCKLCGIKFPSVMLLIKHYRTVHPNINRVSQENNMVDGENNKKCQICGHVCNDLESLKSHIEKFHLLMGEDSERQGDLECDACDFTAKDIEVLVQHKKEQHQQETEAEKELEERKETDNEQEVEKDNIDDNNICEEDDVLLSCCLCPFQTSSEQEVMTHVKNVHSNLSENQQKKGFNCTQCDYKATNNAQLNAHMIKHSDSSANRRFLTQYQNLELLTEKKKVETVQVGVVELNQFMYLGILKEDMETFIFCEQPVGKLKSGSYILDITEESCKVENNDQYIINSDHLIMSFHCQISNGCLCLSKKVKKEIESEIQNYLVM